MNFKTLLIIFLSVNIINVVVCSMQGVHRPNCVNRNQFRKEYRQRLEGLRNEMQIRSSVQGAEIDAYIITSYDEHQTEYVAERDERRKYLTGFTGSNGDAVVTLKSAALWTDGRYIEQANNELDCEWKIFNIAHYPSIATWLGSQLPPESRVGADPHLVPHYLWNEWEEELSKKFLKLVKINKNLIDLIWGDARPPPSNALVKVHTLNYAGEKWETKINKLRSNITSMRADGIIITSLTEIAYILNLRGNDIPFIPVFKAYLVVTTKEILLYANRMNFDDSTFLHLKSTACHNENCVQIKPYADIWRDLRTLSQQWKRILIPTHCVYDVGASHAIYTALPQEIIYERISPIIYMRAQKNLNERLGMKKAHIRDGAAMCDFLSYMEERFLIGDHWTELLVAKELDKTRKSQDLNRGISFKTIVAFGKHAAMPHYTPSNETDVEINESGMLVIDSGGQYLDGTTDVTRTIHLGDPTQEQRKAYTTILSSLIRLSTAVFPNNLKPSEIDVLARGPIWATYYDYPHGTGHGVGSYSSVHESPISISYTSKQRYTFKDGYFISNEPGYYKPNDFGVRLENVLEVIDTRKQHPDGQTFLTFKDVTLVPFEPKLIDRTLLSAQEKRWLNEYNAKVREFVGDELKKQLKMTAFYWMMNKTGHIIEYLPESEYRQSTSNRPQLHFILFNIIFVIFLLSKM